jgi:hypothetical protein
MILKGNYSAYFNPISDWKIGRIPSKMEFLDSDLAQIDTLHPFYDAEGSQEYAG